MREDQRELHEMIFEFADFAVSYFKRPHPRPRMDLWQGRQRPREAFEATPWVVQNERYVVEELSRLRASAAHGHPLHRLGRRGGALPRALRSEEAEGAAFEGFSVSNPCGASRLTLPQR